MPRGRKGRAGGAAAAPGGPAARGGAQADGTAAGGRSWADRVRGPDLSFVPAQRRRPASPARRADAAAVGVKRSGRKSPAADAAAGAEHAGDEQVSLDQSTLDALAGLIDAADPDAVHLEELECAVCTRPSFKCPVETPCGHTFHRICIDMCVDRCGSLCPMCRSDLTGNFHGDVSRADHRMLNRTKVVCPQGCGAQVTFERLEPHVYAECGRTPVICASCGTVSLRRDAAAHRREACTVASLPPCGACGREMRRRDVLDHVQRVSCPNCHERGIRKCLMDVHQRNTCAAALQGGRRGRRDKQPPQQQVQEQHQEQQQPAVRAPPPQNRQQDGNGIGPVVIFNDAVSGNLLHFRPADQPGAIMYTVNGDPRPLVTEIAFSRTDGLRGHMSFRFPRINKGARVPQSAGAVANRLRDLAASTGVTHNFPPHDLRSSYGYYGADRPLSAH
eukprot:TRINITY_DN16895_c0_g2_i1.p1 TRINITY_DN16895_c0_g2~~TRINITY_DN16895_c0_g2_i1.p1  ORF type:complete len:482 (+),score=90.83 TRINITY_DN16895_c0_g2_i1:106-1446(+)